MHIPKRRVFKLLMTQTVGTMDVGTNPLGHTGVCVIKKSKDPFGHTNPSLVTQSGKVESSIISHTFS